MPRALKVMGGPDARDPQETVADRDEISREALRREHERLRECHETWRRANALIDKQTALLAAKNGRG